MYSLLTDESLWAIKKALNIKQNSLSWSPRDLLEKNYEVKFILFLISAAELPYRPVGK